MEYVGGKLLKSSAESAEPIMDAVTQAKCYFRWHGLKFTGKEWFNMSLLYMTIKSLSLWSRQAPPTHYTQALKCHQNNQSHVD